MFIPVLLLVFAPCNLSPDSTEICKTVSKQSYDQAVAACTAPGEKVFYQDPRLERNDWYETICALSRSYNCYLALLGVQLNGDAPNAILASDKYGDYSYSCLKYSYPPVSPRK